MTVQEFLQLPEPEGQRIELIGRPRVEPFCDHRLRCPRLGGGQVRVLGEERDFVAVS